MAWTEQDISTGSLRGTLAEASDSKSDPMVLMLAGSGPVDRDGNLPNMRNDSLKRLAHGLAEAGISSLRVDKRGVGLSRTAGFSERDLTVGSYVADAVSWLEVLHARFGTRRVFVLGHSEGALIATLTAQRKEVAGLILLAGAGEPAHRIIARQLLAAGVPCSLRRRSDEIANSLEHGIPIEEIPPELESLYRPSVQPYLMSWLSRDPAAELARVACPVLILQGTVDLQITIADARRLAAARADSKLVLIDGMNHVLRAAPAERAANLQTYNMPDEPLAPELFPAISAFMRAS